MNVAFLALAGLGLAIPACARKAGENGLPGPHPAYALIDLRPPGLTEGIGGMDFLPDGRLAICTWNGNHAFEMDPVRRGNVYLLSGVELDDASKVTYTRFAANLEEPLGLKAIGDTLYVSERRALLELVDADKDGVADSSGANPKAGYRAVAGYASGGARHEYFFGLLYRDGSFLGAHSLSQTAGGYAAVPQPNAGRGTFVKVDRRTGATTYLAGGANQPFGLGWGPGGDLFATDVQGSWFSGNKLNHVKEGFYYGHPQTLPSPPGDPWSNLEYRPPAVWLPHQEVAAAPGNPVLVPSGPYAGQMLYGDVTYGGIQRIFLEKVAGEWQGAVFRFSAGFEGGVGRLVFGPDGGLYVGQIGHESGNWYEMGKRAYGLAKLKPNGKSAFEMLRVVSRPHGMEIEFTEPVGDGFADPANYSVRSFYYRSTEQFTGTKVGLKALTIGSARVDPASGRKVFLEIGGLEAGRILHIRLNQGLKSEAGGPLWDMETWYTLNAIAPPDLPDPVLSAAPSAGGRPPLETRFTAGGLAVALPADGAYALRLMDTRGAVRASADGSGPRGATATLATAGLPRGVYALAWRGPGASLSRPLFLP